MGRRLDTHLLMLLFSSFDTSTNATQICELPLLMTLRILAFILDFLDRVPSQSLDTLGSSSYLTTYGQQHDITYIR